MRDVEGIELLWDSAKWRAVLNTVMNLQLPNDVETFLNG